MSIAAALGLPGRSARAKIIAELFGSNSVYLLSKFNPSQRRARDARWTEAMSELQFIKTALSGAARRRRWASALRGLWIGLLIGAVLSLLLAGAWHLWPLPLWTRLAIGLSPFLAWPSG